jgi:hypothetical protein
LQAREPQPQFTQCFGENVKAKTKPWALQVLLQVVRQSPAKFEGYVSARRQFSKAAEKLLLQETTRTNTQ